MLAASHGAELYYETAGTGEPVLLIMGLGMASTGWWRTIPVVADRFRVLSFDNEVQVVATHRRGRTHSPSSRTTRQQCWTPQRRRAPTSTASRSAG